MSVLLRRVEIDGASVDCRLAGGVVDAIGAGLEPGPTDDVVDGRHGALVAGLADHHLHLLATAARSGSVDVGPSLDALKTTPGDGWIRAVGAVRELTRADVDAVVADRPVRVQHVGGSLWTLNTRGLEQLGITGPERETGQLWRADARLRHLLPPTEAPDVAAVGAALASYGVTHCTDATPDLDVPTADLLADAVPQHLLLLGAAEGPGPRKVVVGDHDLPTPDALAATIAGIHARGRAVALHVVTRAALVVTLSALRSAGPVPGDRVEHAAVCDDELAAALADLGAVVVTQPGLLVAHGDRYLREVDAPDRPSLWRCGGLRRHGVPVALGSDAPYGPLDPWMTLRAARDRTTRAGIVVGAAERIDAGTALRMVQTELTDPAGPPRRVAVGAPADLVLLHVPLVDALDALDAAVVRHTYVGGALIHSA